MPVSIAGTLAYAVREETIMVTHTEPQNSRGAASLSGDIPIGTKYCHRHPNLSQSICPSRFRAGYLFN